MVDFNNDIILAANPGELYHELGRQIKKGSPVEKTFVLSLTNDRVGYIPTREAIEAVLADENWARELGQAGLAYVKEYFSWPRIVDQVMALYSPAPAGFGNPAGAEAACPERAEGAPP